MSRPAVQLVEHDPAVVPGAMPIVQVADEPFSLLGTTVGAVVDSAVVAGAVLRALMRGADAVIRLELADRTGFLDAAGRVADVRVPAAPALDADQRALLDRLARGQTAGEAARQIGMSVRTAHRRLSAARATLGASCNAEAIARLGSAHVDG